MDTLGERIKKIRLAKKMTRKDLGAILEMKNPDSRIEVYETDRKQPRKAMLNRIAAALHVSENYLLTGNLDDFTIKHLYEDGILDKGNFDDEKPQHYFQLNQLIIYNEELIMNCLKQDDYEKIGEIIYNRIIEKEGNLDKLTPFMTTDEYNEYCYEEQEKMDDLIARGEGYFDENNEFHYEPNMQELIENGDAYYDENGFFQYTENTEEDI